MFAEKLTDSFWFCFGEGYTDIYFHFQLIKNSVYIFQTKCPIIHCEKKKTEGKFDIKSHSRSVEKKYGFIRNATLRLNVHLTTS